MKSNRTALILSAALLAPGALAGFDSPAHAGTLVAWGRNNFGQTIVPTGAKFTAIAAGYNHHQALVEVPEPSSLLLAAMAGLLLAGVRRVPTRG
jgi:hypothetical protein